MKPTQNQQIIIDNILNSKNKYHILKGAGGTGKSFTIQHLTQSALARGMTVQLTTTTNASTKILQEYSRREVKTIHSLLSLRLAQVKFRQELIQGSTKNLMFKSLLVIDEMSMIDSTLLTYLLLKENKFKKILFVGDMLQLPAVGEEASIEETLNPEIHELTEILRMEAKNSQAIKLMKYLRNTITEALDGSTLNCTLPICKSDFSIEFIHDHNEFLQKYYDDKDEKLLLSYRNSYIEKVSKWISAYSNNNRSNFYIGQELVLSSPMLEGIYKNNEKVTVLNVVQNSEFHEKEAVELTIGAEDKPTALLFKLKYKKDRDELLTKYQEELDEKNYWDVFNNSSNIYDSQVMTINKAQGSSINNVYINATDLWNAYKQKKNDYNNPISFVHFLKLYYVAISRMRKKAIIYIGNGVVTFSYSPIRKDKK